MVDFVIKNGFATGDVVETTKGCRDRGGFSGVIVGFCFYDGDLGVKVRKDDGRIVVCNGANVRQLPSPFYDKMFEFLSAYHDMLVEAGLASRVTDRRVSFDGMNTCYSVSDDPRAAFAIANAFMSQSVKRPIVRKHGAFRSAVRRALMTVASWL